MHPFASVPQRLWLCPHLLPLDAAQVDAEELEQLEERADAEGVSVEEVLQAALDREEPGSSDGGDGGEGDSDEVYPLLARPSLNLPRSPPTGMSRVCAILGGVDRETVHRLLGQGPSSHRPLNGNGSCP